MATKKNDPVSGKAPRKFTQLDTEQVVWKKKPPFAQKKQTPKKKGG